MIQSIEAAIKKASRLDTAQKMNGFTIATCKIDLRAWPVQRSAFKDLG